MGAGRGRGQGGRCRHGGCMAALFAAIVAPVPAAAPVLCWKDDRGVPVDGFMAHYLY